MFLRNPGFTATAVTALALGVGANTAIFSLVNRLPLTPCSYSDPERVVFFMNVSPQGSGPGASPAKFNFWKSQTRTIEKAAAWRFTVANYTTGDVPEQIQQTPVTASFFDLLGASVL